MSPIYMFIITNLILISSASCGVQPLFISCGIPKYTTAISTADNRVWRSDDDPSFAPPNLNAISTTANSTSQVPPYDTAPFDTARLFGSPLTYNFSLSPGPKFLRLYFTSSSFYNNIPPSQFFVSLQTPQLVLLKNYSSFLNAPDDNKQPIIVEFHITVEKHLNLTFTPSDGGNNNNSNYGFINAIEIVPIPEGLYINLTQTTPLQYVSNPIIPYTPLNTTALQTLYRLNVGGYPVIPKDDSGSMWRTWYDDEKYLIPGGFNGQKGAVLYGTAPEVNYTLIPSYVAPKLVYATERMMGNSSNQFKLTKNLTWSFEVDSGFDYLVRLHFCQMLLNLTSSQQMMFNVYIDSQMADEMFDIFRLLGGLAVAKYKDYVVRVSGGGGGGGGGGDDAGTRTNVPLRLDLHPLRRYITDVILNGLEIMKISEQINNNGESNLAAPNPQRSQMASPPTPLPVKESQHHRSLVIIVGTIGGTLFVSLFLIASMSVYKRRVNKKTNMDTNTGSKDKWAPLSFDLGTTTTSTMSSSLPSDLCRHFTFTQIRVATRDFDEDLVIGRGGFGKVYKGSIDGGATTVAIKRLNTTSKQGFREFETEIEMLSRLRHVHLVSLIGFCEDQGEMILIYEYMTRGTLRDHLFYKLPVNFDNNNNINPLSWKQRLMICLGSARGLHYLHAGAKQLIIHRDVKSTNILLDEKWTDQPGYAHVSTAVKGSAGYLDPEYYRRNKLTEKSDVYSFGVVLFEVLCARAAVDPKLPKEEANLAMWARSRYKKGTLHTIVDPNLTGQIAPESLRKFAEIADMCVRDRGNERPSMGHVVWGLEFALQLQETAENNNVANGTPDESFDLSSNYVSAVDIGFSDDGVSTNSIDKFSESTVVEGSSKRLMDSKSMTRISSDYYLVDTESGSVFSEIANPKAR